jgi:phage portal protein BeeE
MTFHDLIELDSIFMDLTGNDFWLIFGNAQGVPVEIWPLMPQWVRVVPSPESFIAGYVVEVEGGQPQLFLPIKRSPNGTGILHFKSPSATSFFYGQGPVGASWTAAMTDDAATAYRYWFYKNSARPDGILSSEKGLQEHQIQRIRDQWQATFQGEPSSHRTAVLDSALKYTPISFSPKDTDVARDREMARDDQLVAYGVPKAALGIETGDVGRREEQIRLYYHATIKPACVKRAATITDLLCPVFGPGIVCEPDFSEITPLQEDELRRAQVDEIYLRNGVITVNEVREQEGREPVAWGDVPLVSITTAPLGSAPSLGGGDGGDLPPASMAALADLLRCVRSAPADDQARLDLWSALIQKAASQEATLRAKLAQIYATAGEEVANAVRRGVSAPAAATAALQGVMHPMLEHTLRAALPGVLEAGWRQATRLLRAGQRRQVREVAVGTLAFDLSIPQLADYLAQRPLRYADIITANLSGAIRSTLADLASSGTSIETMAQELEALFETLSASRARLIARTEVIGASNLAAHVAYAESGAVSAEEWLTAGDERVRITHQVAGEQYRQGGSLGPSPLGAGFIVGGAFLRFPADPAGPISETAQCRCIALPVTAED